MKLDSFLAVKSPPVSGERQQSSVGVDGSPKVAVTRVVPEPSQDHALPPTEVTRDVTPSGIEILYQSSPKRLYKVRNAKALVDPSRPDWDGWVEVPSVTTVLDVLRKDGLAWWGQGRGAQGVIDLFGLGALTTEIDWQDEKEYIVIPQGEDNIVADEAAIVDLLKQHKLTVNHRLDQAADRGVSVHDALETWARNGHMPNPEEFPETEKGYVQGLLNFIEDVNPAPMKCEVMVGSVKHQYAGRFDLVLGFVGPFEYTSKCYPKRADKREQFLETETVLCDLKTSKGVYTSHHLQLAAYELAAVEGGYSPTNRQAVIHVTANGKYELVFSTATAEQFLAVRSVYAALEGLK